MWEQTFRRWMDLVFWWLPKDRPRSDAPQEDRAPEPQAAPQRPAAQQPKVAEPAAEAPAAAADPVPDDLTVIKGIGPAVQEQLRALGIRTFGELATADPDALTEQLKGRQPISSARVRGWTEAAGERAAASD